MAFPVITRSLGELITPAIWNADFVANMNLLGPHLIARKTSDEPLASNTTLQDDDTLQLPVSANDVWLLKYNLKMTIPVTPSAKMAFTFPAGGDVNICGTEYNAAGTLVKISFQGTTTPTAPQDFLGSTANRHIVLEGLFVNAGTGGTLVLQWAQNTSNASSVIMKAQSTLWGVKLA
jgi:hypothetical protein